MSQHHKAVIVFMEKTLTSYIDDFVSENVVLPKSREKLCVIKANSIAISNKMKTGMTEELLEEATALVRDLDVYAYTEKLEDLTDEFDFLHGDSIEEVYLED